VYALHVLDKNQHKIKDFTPSKYVKIGFTFYQHKNNCVDPIFTNVKYLVSVLQILHNRNIYLRFLYAPFDFSRCNWSSFIIRRVSILHAYIMPESNSITINLYKQDLIQNKYNAQVLS